MIQKTVHKVFIAVSNLKLSETFHTLQIILCQASTTSWVCVWLVVRMVWPDAGTGSMLLPCQTTLHAELSYSTVGSVKNITAAFQGITNTLYLLDVHIT